tara:strand:- start:96 stop:503 length:408 start_codon:yes stop_codon:yes gene_type:complete
MAFALLKNVTLFKNLGTQTGGNKFNLLQVSNFIATIITISITIMDLGVDYNINEISFYRNPLVQIVGVFAVAYSSTDGNMMLSLILSALWFFIKHRFNFEGFMKQEDPEDAYKTTVKHLLRRLKNKADIGNTYLN